MTRNYQEREDGSFSCNTCSTVFSSLKAVCSHQRAHKTGKSSLPPTPPPPPPPPPPNNPAEESEEEVEIRIRGDNDRRRQGTLKLKKEHKKEDFSPDELEVADALLLLLYGFDVPPGSCSSGKPLYSNSSPIPAAQENHKMEEKVNQEDDFLGRRPITKMKDDGSIGLEWSPCPKGLRTQQRSIRKAAATVAEWVRSPSAHVIKEYKSDICGKATDSGQALCGHKMIHSTSKETVVDVDDHHPEKNLIAVDDDTGLDIDPNNIPVQVPEDMIMAVDGDGDAAGTAKKEVAEDVIMEDIHERNDDDCERSRLSFDLNQLPSDTMKGIDLNQLPSDVREGIDLNQLPSDVREGIDLNLEPDDSNEDRNSDSVLSFIIA